MQAAAEAPLSSGNDVVQHVPMNIGQSHVAAAEAIRELLMIHPGQMQHRRVQVVKITLILNRAVPVIIRCPVDSASPHSAAAQKERETKRTVVPPIAALGKRSPAKLPGENNQRRIQQPPLLEVLDQAGDWLVYGPCVVSMVFPNIAVSVPPVIPGDPRTGQFDEPNSLLHHPPCDEALEAV